MPRIFLLPLLFTCLLCSCETTGDPTQGGLFGWSSNKADTRQVELQHKLGQVEGDTAYQKGRSHALEQQQAAKERELNANPQ